MSREEMNNKDLWDILKSHKEWLSNKDGGECADLSGADLRCDDLSEADLRSADLRSADLRSADLWDANLSGADLRGVSFRKADLRNADLCGADLRNADLCGADLCGANLWDADLSDANLDYSCLPLWRGSLRANFDDRQLKQIAYHLVKAGLQSKNASAKAKAELKKLIDFANKFHRAEECGFIEE